MSVLLHRVRSQTKHSLATALSDSHPLSIAVVTCAERAVVFYSALKIELITGHWDLECGFPCAPIRFCSSGKLSFLYNHGYASVTCWKLLAWAFPSHKPSHSFFLSPWKSLDVESAAYGTCLCGNLAEPYVFILSYCVFWCFYSVLHTSDTEITIWDANPDL